MRTILTLIFAVMISHRCFAVDSSIALDSPLHFQTAKEVYELSVHPPHNVHPAIGEALTYLCAYEPSEDTPQEIRDALLLALCNGRTPRQLITIGFVLRLEILKKALAEDQFRIATNDRLFPDESISDSKKLYELRSAQCRGAISAMQEQINALLKPKPNQSSEVTPTAVTPAASAPSAPSAGVPHQ